MDSTILADKDGNLLITRANSPFVYKFDQDSLKLRKFAEIECGIDIAEPVKGENYNEYMSKIGVVKYKYFPFNAYQNGKWLIISFHMGTAVYDIQTGEGMYTMNPFPDKDSTTFPFQAIRIVGYGQDGSVICTMSASDLLRIREKCPKDMKFMPSDEIFEGLTEESNPILIRYKFKQ